jgi:mannose-6-phosphate isomerase
LLSRVPVKAGDFIYVPATTPHAIGPGIVLYELQQFSDTTYRVYDWGRLGLDGKPRQLHLDKALTVMDLHPRPIITMLPPENNDSQGNGVTALIRAMYFGLERVRVTAPEADYKLDGVCHLLSVIQGAVRVNDVLITKGRSALIPAGLNHYTLRSEKSEVADNAEPMVLRAWPVVRDE